MDSRAFVLFVGYPASVNQTDNKMQKKVDPPLPEAKFRKKTFPMSAHERERKETG